VEKQPNNSATFQKREPATLFQISKADIDAAVRNKQRV
jgi:hypothetical protein